MIRIVSTIMVAVIAGSAMAQIKLKAKSPVGILTQKKVAADLQLTQEQQNMIKKLGDEYRAAIADLQAAGPVNPEEAQMQIDEAGATIEKKVRDLLTKEQQVRRTQLVLQLGGPSTMSEKPYSEQLKLTEAQMTSINEIFEQYMDEMMELQQSEKNIDQLTAKRNAKSKQYREMAEKLLTAEQTKVLTELKGKPIAD